MCLRSTAGETSVPEAKPRSLTTAHRANVCAAKFVDGDRLISCDVEGRLIAWDMKEASVLVVFAGMEGALASVVGGLVASPVIGVPTSIGYGTSFGGVSALLTMLNSCASGLSVVNIDNGFGAGYQASLINKITVAQTSREPANQGFSFKKRATAVH